MSHRVMSKISGPTPRGDGESPPFAGRFSPLSIHSEPTRAQGENEVVQFSYKKNVQYTP